MFTEDGRFIKGRWLDCQIWQDEAARQRFVESGDKSGLVYEETFDNGITTPGLNYLLEVGFRGDAMSPVAQRAPWYAGLIDDASFSAVNPADTVAVHAGWIECTAYSETDRQLLAFPAASARAILASVSFTMNATKTLRGLMVVDDDTKGGIVTGLLWSTGLFATPPTVVSGNVFTANYSLTD